MTDEKYRLYDVIFKVFGLTGLLMGGWIGLHQYNDTSEKNFRADFWAKQLHFYFEATASASTLATSDDSDQIGTARNTFWRLYYGPLAVVEDQTVASAMIAFGKCLKATDCATTTKERLALKLAHASRKSIANTWSISLPELQNRL